MGKDILSNMRINYTDSLKGLKMLMVLMGYVRILHYGLWEQNSQEYRINKYASFS